MNQRIHRRAVLHFGAALCASLLAPAARACEFFSPTLRITHPWTRATAEGVKTAIVNMRFDEVSADDRLIGIETPIASGAEMGGTWAGPKVSFAIPKNKTSWLSETGTHVRLTGLKQRLEVGRSYPLKLTFERGGIIDANLEVDYAE